jgi:predicted MFS family arabinose efflux permease
MAPVEFLQTLPNRWRGLPSDFRWFIIGLCLVTAGGHIVDPAFNNFLRDTFKLGADARGKLEFPRELPGFLVAMTSGILFFLPEVRTAAVAIFATAIGMLGLAWAGNQYGVMIAFLVLMSTGQHLLMPMRSSIVLSFAKQGRQASLLGQTGSITTLAGILGALFGWWFFATFARNLTTYRVAFIAGAIVTAIGALAILKMRLPELAASGPRPKIVFNAKYWLYYVLSIFHGARKQVFITFAPWVLITVYHRGPSTFAALAVVSAALGIFWQPIVGWLVDRFGERTVLMSDGLILVAVCVSYGFAHRMGTGGWVLLIVYASFILDQLLFAVGIARTTYIQKIAERPEDVTASLSLGVTLDHAVSMSIPILGGATWVMFGVEYVFVGAAVLALCNSIMATFVRIPDHARPTGMAAPNVAATTDVRAKRVAA